MNPDKILEVFDNPPSVKDLKRMLIIKTEELKESKQALFEDYYEYEKKVRERGSFIWKQVYIAYFIKFTFVVWLTLLEAFRRYASVVSVTVHKLEAKEHLYAFVEFDDADDRDRALVEMHDTLVLGRSIKVGRKTTKNQKKVMESNNEAQSDETVSRDEVVMEEKKDEEVLETKEEDKKQTKVMECSKGAQSDETMITIEEVMESSTKGKEEKVMETQEEKKVRIARECAKIMSDKTVDWFIDLTPEEIRERRKDVRAWEALTNTDKTRFIQHYARRFATSVNQYPVVLQMFQALDSVEP